MSIASLRFTLIAIAVAITASSGAAQIRIDQRLPDYRPIDGISGSIKSIGSDTLNNLMSLWGEEFIKHYPRVSIEIEGKG